MLDDTEFGFWLSGFVDGEGSFGCLVQKRSNGTRYLSVSFRIGLRADELPLLESIQERTGLGSLYYAKRNGPGHHAWIWEVRSKKDCLAFVELLERFPLQSKKLRDFEVWAQIVREWNAIARTRYAAGQGMSLDSIENLAYDLRKIREYDPQYERQVPSHELQHQ